MVLGKLPVPGRPAVWMIVRQGPIVLAVGADGGCLDIFTLLYLFSSLSPSLWETARYRLKYCLKGPSNPKQPTNNHLKQPLNRPGVGEGGGFGIERVGGGEIKFLTFKGSVETSQNITNHKLITKYSKNRLLLFSVCIVLESLIIFIYSAAK